MAFVIDTGPVDHGPLRLVPDWFIDQCPDHGDVARVCRAYAEHLVGQMAGPAKLDTVRKHLAAALPFLRELAEIDPAAFDWIITEYAERSFAAVCASAPGGSRQSNAPFGQIDKGN